MQTSSCITARTAPSSASPSTRTKLEATGGGPSTSYSAAISADGRYVVFESNATNLVSGGSDYIADVYLRDTVAGATSRPFVNAEGGSISDSQPYPSISANGRCIGFRSMATDLVEGDTTWYWNDAFVYDRVLGTFHRASVSTEGAEGNSYATNVTVATDDDGTCRWVTFTSYSNNLVADDTNWSDDVFIHDLRTGMTWRVVGPDGQGNDRSQSPAISQGGRFVAFRSYADNLVAGDTNGFSDLYVYRSPDRRHRAALVPARWVAVRQ